MFEDGVPDVLQARGLKVPTDRVTFASCGAHLTAFCYLVKRFVSLTSFVTPYPFSSR